MRKNRGSFFENSTTAAGFNPGPNVNMPGMNPGPMGFGANSYSSFYAGPGNMNGTSEIEERLAKIERSIQRLDARISKIEGMNIKSTDDFESTTNNMYIL